MPHTLNRMIIEMTLLVPCQYHIVISMIYYCAVEGREGPYFPRKLQADLTDLKIFAKILAERLKSLLPKWISC